MIWLLALVVLHVSQPSTWQWETPGIWFPPAGVGFLLAAWLGPRAALLVATDSLLVLLQSFVLGTPLAWNAGGMGLVLGVAAALLTGLEVWVAWWGYFVRGRGQRGLIDPHSATLFLVLVPGGLAFGFAVAQTLLLCSVVEQIPFWELCRSLWFSRALGIVALVPPFLVLATPPLTRRGWIAPEPPQQEGGADALLPLPLGGRIEIAGLALATGIFGLFLSVFHARGDWSTSPLAMLPLLLIIWASLRQGVRGGTLVATTMAVPALTILSQTREADILLTLQANLLAQCSTALLVGVSFNWIRTSEVRYRHVVEHVPVVLYSARLLTSNGSACWPESVEITFASPACREVLGREPTEILGDYQSWMDCVHPEDHELLQAALTQLWRFKEPVTCEYRLAPASGQGLGTSNDGRPHAALTADHGPQPSARWLRDTFVPLFDEAGQLTGWEGVATEITAQRNLADDLRRTTGMLHTLVNHLPAGVFFVDAPSGSPILVNARARQLLGQREDLTAGLTHLAEVYRLHRPDGTLYPADEIPVCAALRRGTTSVCDDIVVHRSDGRRVPLVSWAAPIDLGGLGRYDAAVWVLEDLTSLRQAESALRESEARLRTVIENIAAGVLILDDKGVVLDSNPAASLLLGMPGDDLRGRNLTEPVGTYLRAEGTPLPPQEHPATICARTRRPVSDTVIGLGPAPTAGASGQPEGAENGAPPTKARWLTMRALPYSPAGNRLPPRVILICTDISAQHEAQAGERQLAVGLEHTRQLGVIGQIASGLAHDFNNYLTVVLASAGLASRSLPAEHGVQTDLRNILQASERASQLARQLIALSKAPLTPIQQIDLNELIERTLALIQVMLGKGIRVTLELNPRVPQLRGYETALQQVLINLCLNARDAMPHGGQLLLTTTLLTEPPPDVTASATPAWVCLQVTDSGQGIAEHVQKSLFLTPVSNKQNGAGLGLWMVRRIVQEHGGQIHLHSEAGHGTQVEIVLPAGTGSQTTA